MDACRASQDRYIYNILMHLDNEVACIEVGCPAVKCFPVVEINEDTGLGEYSLKYFCGMSRCIKTYPSKKELKLMK